MIYAPVIIPTLNRKKHLQRCISSLQKNSWAQNTTLIIGVDYPPTESYRKGYEEVCAYLNEGISGFENVEIIYHKTNLGPYENYCFLKRYAISKWDRFIFTEDDNEMSMNFLEYMDKGLDIFRDNKDVLAICANGAENEEETPGDNIVVTHNFSAHGYGIWKDREEQLANDINRKYLTDIGGNINKIWKLYRYDSSLVFACQSALLQKEKVYQLTNGNIPIIDMTIKIYAVLENKFVVCPCQKKARNWGYDGSGVNCPDVSGDFIPSEIDEKSHFEYRYSEKIKESRSSTYRSLETKIRVFAATIRLISMKIIESSRMKI